MKKEIKKAEEIVETMRTATALATIGLGVVEVVGLVAKAIEKKKGEEK